MGEAPLDTPSQPRKGRKKSRPKVTPVVDDAILLGEGDPFLLEMSRGVGASAGGRLAQGEPSPAILVELDDVNRRAGRAVRPAANHELTPHICN